MVSSRGHLNLKISLTDFHTKFPQGINFIFKYSLFFILYSLFLNILKEFLICELHIIQVYNKELRYAAILF